MSLQVVPAVIPESRDDLAENLARLRGVSPVVHVDVCDGKLVPSRSWPVSGDGGEWAAIVDQEEGLPMWESFEFEFDVMAEDPLALANEAIEAGAARIFIHLEASGTADAFASLLADGRAEIWLAGGAGLDLEPYLETIGRAAGFLQMGIEKIGFQGQPFSPRALDNVRAVREAFPELPIAFDGAVSVETAAAIVGAGATRLIVGSAIVGSENPREAAEEIEAAAGEGL